MARLLHVDLKTIHNWVNQGHMSGRRTKGRHLRFDRTEVVRFMREYGYPIPESVGAVPPRVVFDGADAKGGPSALRRVALVSVCDGLLACCLAVASGDEEVLVIDLDRRDARLVRELVAALRLREATARLAVVGLSKRRSARDAFLSAGGDAALALTAQGELRNLVRWMTGSVDVLPSAVELRPG